MKTACFLLSLVAGFFVAGCGRGNNAPPPAPTVSTPAPETPAQAAPNGYLGAMASAQRLAVKTVDLSSLNQNIQLFNATEGRYPKDLDELVSTHYIPQVPAAPTGMKLAYDATQGKVTMVAQ
jgi:hypothetical protein